MGLKAAKELGVPLPVTKAARGEVDKLVQAGHTECDFAILIEQVATELLARLEVADRLR